MGHVGIALVPTSVINKGASRRVLKKAGFLTRPASAATIPEVAKGPLCLGTRRSVGQGRSKQRDEALEEAMEKPADTQYPIHALLRRRWSPRAFDDRFIEPEKLRSLFEAARWAPSSNNEQPWRFLVATKENTIEHDLLFNCLVEGNQKWAHRAPALLLSVAKLQFEDGSPNRHAFHDTGMAVENLIVQATAFGLVAHQMAGFRIEQARTDCKIPAEYEPVAMIAVGYPGDSAQLSDRLRAREVQPRVRNPLTEFVYSAIWAQPSPLIR